MKTVFALLLFALATVFLAIEEALLAGMCLAAAALILAARILSKTAKGTKAVGSALTHGIEEDAEKADTAGFETGVAKKGLENMADLAGHQAFSGQKKWHYIGDQHQFKFKGMPSISDACNTLIDSFKKVFK